MSSLDKRLCPRTAGQPGRYSKYWIFTPSHLPPTCDETNRAAGLRGWWSRRRLPVHRVTTRAHFVLKGEIIVNFSLRFIVKTGALALVARTSLVGTAESERPFKESPPASPPRASRRLAPSLWPLPRPLLFHSDASRVNLTPQEVVVCRRFCKTKSQLSSTRVSRSSSHLGSTGAPVYGSLLPCAPWYGSVLPCAPQAVLGLSRVANVFGRFPKRSKRCKCHSPVARVTRHSRRADGLRNFLPSVEIVISAANERGLQRRRPENRASQLGFMEQRVAS